MRDFINGDVVKIKEWDDMERAYGIIGGNIIVPFAFTPEMRHLCGRTLKIKNIKRNSSQETIYIMIDPNEPRSINYNFSRGMFTICINEKESLKVIFQTKTIFNEDLI